MANSVAAAAAAFAAFATAAASVFGTKSTENIMLEVYAMNALLFALTLAVGVVSALHALQLLVCVC